MGWLKESGFWCFNFGVNICIICFDLIYLGFVCVVDGFGEVVFIFFCFGCLV